MPIPLVSFPPLVVDFLYDAIWIWTGRIWTDDVRWRIRISRHAGCHDRVACGGRAPRHISLAENLEEVGGFKETKSNFVATRLFF